IVLRHRPTEKAPQKLQALVGGGRPIDTLQEVAHIALGDAIKAATSPRGDRAVVGACYCIHRVRAVFAPRIALQEQSNRLLEGAGIRARWVASFRNRAQYPGRRITRLSEPVNGIAPYRELARATVLPAAYRPRLVLRAWLYDQVQAHQQVIR